MLSRFKSLIVHSAGFSLLLIAGCGGDGPETIPVYGNVQIVGRELPKVCRLFFVPQSSEGVSRPSVAEMQEDGSYSVTAFKGSDGLLPGSYRVEVSFFDLKPGGNPNSETGWVERRHDAGELVVDADSSGVEYNVTVPAKG